MPTDDEECDQCDGGNEKSPRPDHKRARETGETDAAEEGQYRASAAGDAGGCADAQRSE
jgi:hypothetical protein